MAEPLLTPDENRYVMFPIVHEDIWCLYKKAVASFWTVEEVDLSNDLADWAKLTDDERYFIKMVMRSNELAEEVELTPSQRELLHKLENERLKQAAFDQFKGFLELGSVYADYRNHISAKIHPEYKQQELLREALASLQEREVEGDFGHRPQFKVARLFYRRDDREDPENTAAAAAAAGASSSSYSHKAIPSNAMRTQSEGESSQFT